MCRSNNGAPDSEKGGRPPARSQQVNREMWARSSSRYQVIGLSLVSFALYSRFMRASMLDVISSDYVRTARAKACPSGA